MSFDVNNNYAGTFYGKDRLGFTTPDCDASESLQPFLPVSYPAPWLPIIRRDEGHPVAAGVVISSGMAVGVDKSSALIPAGLQSGSTGAGGNYCILVYGSDDVMATINPQTGAKVQAAGEYVVLAAPSDGAAGDTHSATTNASASTAASIPVGVTITSNDLTFAHACTLVPGGTGRTIGYALHNVFQYLGGANTVNTTGGWQYVIDSSNPVNFKIHNYTHEMGTAIRTNFVLRVPWIGATPTTIATLAASDSITGYTPPTSWNKSFTHFTGAVGAGAGNLFPGCSVVASDQFGAADAGHYAPYNSSIHKPDQIIGRVLGVESMYPIRDLMDRVRTQFDRAQQLVGPFAESHPIQMMMGGSSTRGIDYQINLSNNGVLRAAADQGKTIHPEYATYIYLKFQS
jgi:hypothetical protein